MSKGTKAHLHTVRCADGRFKTIRMTRASSMAAMCTECLGFEDNPSTCTACLCPLYPFRAKTLATLRGTMETPDAVPKEGTRSP